MITDVKLRIMTETDLSFVNMIRNREDTRAHLRDTREISLDETVMWFNEYKPKWYIIEDKERADERVGYVRTSKDTGESICVGCDIHPDMRRSGYAKSAYSILLDMLYRSGYLVIWLEVFAENEKAYNLYRSLGFREVNRHTFDNREAIVMVHSSEE